MENVNIVFNFILWLLPILLVLTLMVAVVLWIISLIKKNSKKKIENKKMRKGDKDE